jgi:hypothetical protein
MTRRPTKVKAFMPNRMSLVNTTLLPLAGLAFSRRQRSFGIYPSLANLHYAPAAPNFACRKKRGVSSDGKVSDHYLALRLRAQQHRDKEDGQAHHRGDENRTRQADLVSGRV